MRTARHSQARKDRLYGLFALEDTSGNTSSTSLQVEVVKSGGSSDGGDTGTGGGSKGKGKKK